MRLVDDLASQKLRLLQLSVRLHALSRVSPPRVQRASVAATVFGRMPADSADACGHSCIAVRACVFEWGRYLQCDVAFYLSIRSFFCTLNPFHLSIRL